MTYRQVSRRDPQFHGYELGAGIAPLPYYGAGVRRPRGRPPKKQMMMVHPPVHPVHPVRVRARPKRKVGGMAPVPSYGAGTRKTVRKAPTRMTVRRMMGGEMPLGRRAKGTVGLTTKGVPRRRSAPSAAQLAHRRFIKANVNSMPGATPQLRMKQVNQEYTRTRK